MTLDHLALENIRLFRLAHVDLDSRAIVFFGRNGEGKTTILEAVHVLAALRSFRAGRLRDLVRGGSQCGSIRAVASEGPMLGMDLTFGGRRLIVGGKPVYDVGAFAGRIRVVALAPEHHAVVRGGPEERRRFLDRLIFSRDPAYLDTVRRYNRALRQKQALLREKLSLSRYRERVAPWNEELCAAGEAMRRARRQAVSLLATLGAAHYESLGGGPPLEISYSVGASDIADELTCREAAEHASGRCLIGPHRDDMVMRLGGRIAAETASQGECAAILLGLKMAEREMTEESGGPASILLLDDPGATLDWPRRERLFSWIASVRTQVLIGTADPTVAQASVEAGARMLVKREEPADGGFSIARWVTG